MLVDKAVKNDLRLNTRVIQSDCDSVVPVDNLRNDIYKERERDNKICMCYKYTKKKVLLLF